jgi:hypothetical protein
MDNWKTIFAAAIGAATVQFCNLPIMDHSEEQVVVQPAVFEALEAGCGRCKHRCQRIQNNTAPIQQVVNQQNELTVQINNNFERLQFQIDALFEAIENIEGQAGPAGPKGDKGDKGDPGRDGLSPSVADILAELDLGDLKGEKGDPGEPGKTPEIDYSKFVIDYSKFNLDYSQLKGEKGDKGDTGPAGTFDPDSIDGNGNGVLDELPPWHFVVVDPTGRFKPSPPVSVYLGDTLHLVLTPASMGLPGGLSPEVNPIPQISKTLALGMIFPKSGGSK